MKQWLWAVLAGAVLLSAIGASAQTAVVIRGVSQGDGGTNLPITGTVNIGNGVTATVTGAVTATVGFDGGPVSVVNVVQVAIVDGGPLPVLLQFDGGPVTVTNTVTVTGAVTTSGTATVTQGAGIDGGRDWATMAKTGADGGYLLSDLSGNLQVTLANLIAGENIDAGYQYVNTAAQGGCTTTEVLVLGDAGVAAMQIDGGFAGRRSIEIQNNGGPDAGVSISCRAGAGSYVRRIAAGGTWALDVSEGAVLACIQSSGTDNAAGSGAAVTECK